MNGRLIKDGLPCPACGGSDPGAIYENKSKKDGSPFYMFQCFSGGCGFKQRIEDLTNYEEEILEVDDKKVEERMENIGLLTPGQSTALDNPSEPWGKRNINEDTMNYYGVTVAPNVKVTRNRKALQARIDQGLPTTGLGLIFPFYTTDSDPKLVAQKVRTEVDKKGAWYKLDNYQVSQVGFFGQQLFNPAVSKEIAITFGEFDAMAVYQMLGVPAVSVTNGDTSAQAQFRKEYSWLSKFEKIIIVPDNDESCRSVMAGLGSIFPRKTKIVELSKYKDPCEYLQNSEFTLFRQEFYAAQSFSPEKIISLYSLRELVLQDPPEPIADYPWGGINQKTGGIWAGELVTLKAFPKAGKTTISSEIAYHLTKNYDYPIGLIYLEETQRDLVVRFATMELSKNLQRKEIYDSVALDDITKAIDTVLSDEKIHVLDHFGSCQSDFLEEKIKEFVLAKGCQFIFFDHVSMAIADESNKDERMALDRLIYSIKQLTTGILDSVTMEKDGKIVTEYVKREPTVFMVTHVNDDGKPRGSRVSVQACNTMISLKRDKEATDAIKRNTLEVYVEENRRLGDTGLACCLQYSHQTGRLTEIPIVSEEKKGYVYEG